MREFVCTLLWEQDGNVEGMSEEEDKRLMIRKEKGSWFLGKGKINTFRTWNINLMV